MGLIEGYRLAADIASGGDVLPFPRKIDGIASPWADTSNLVPMLIAEDIYGASLQPVSRLEALRVPAIAKGRAILHSVIGGRPLVAMDKTGKLSDEAQPSWLYRSDTGISPQQRNCAVLDDILFQEASLLAVKRGSKNTILDAVHVPYSQWTVSTGGRILVNGAEVDADQVIYIPGPGPGLLVMAAETIRAARETDQAWQKRVRNPFPAMVLHENEDFGMTTEEAATYVESVATARRNPDSAVMFVPYKMSLESHAAETTDLFEGGRNALRIDFANFLNLPASLLDGSVSEASLTYSTQEGRRNELFDYSIGYWATPIEQALSLDNVVPRGQRIRFDFTDYLTTEAAPTGAAEQD